MNVKHFIKRVVAALLLIHCAGCAHTVKVTYRYGSPCAAELPCKVSLSLSKEYCGYRHVTPAIFLVQDEYAVSYGPALREYAIYVARSVFGDVQVVDGNGPIRSESAVVLKPKVISSSLEPPTFRTPSGALAVQWTFADPKTGQALFAMPVQCEYIAKWGFGPRLKLVPAALLEELGGTTIKRFSTSKEVQRLSGH